MAVTFSLEDPVFADFAFYAVIVVLKLFFMGFLTSFCRARRGVFANKEDVRTARGKEAAEKLKPIYNDEQIERIRRNHLNDLENIPAFLFIGMIYLLTDPTPKVALWHFRGFAISRIMHTLAYQTAMQPWRGIFYTVGLFATVSMCVQILQKVVR